MHIKLTSIQNLLGVAEQKDHEEIKEGWRPPTATTSRPQQIGFWMNFEMLLLDISVHDEKFEVIAWFDVMWKEDGNSDLEALFKNTTRRNDSFRIDYTSLSDDIRCLLPFRRNFLLNAVDLDFYDCFIKKLDHRHQSGSASSGSGSIFVEHFAFKATINERFELDEFPFDAQFLNLKIRINSDRFYLCSHCPRWLSSRSVTDGESASSSKRSLFHLNITDSIEAVWHLESPVIDFRAQKGRYRIPFHLIRLRVVRNPSFYIMNGVLPLFLVVSCSFAQVAIKEEDAADKLEFVVTILLTVAAFQFAFSSDLPQTSETTHIDVYIICAYLILSSMVAHIALCPLHETLFLTLCAMLWLGASLFFVWKWKRKTTPQDWRLRSIKEFEEWDLNAVSDLDFHTPSKWDVKGTRDTSDPSFEHY